MRYLLFVGSGRTGSTLVGQLLNNHPEILISNEERILNICLDKNQKISQLIYKIKNSAEDDYMFGSFKYERETNSDTKAKKWQKDWTPIKSDDKLFKSKNLKYIGDKKQGGNSSILKCNPEVLELIDVDFVPISIIRHPYQVFMSYVNVGLEKEESAKKAIEDLFFGLEFVKNHKGFYYRYEEILKNSDLWCENISKDLGLSSFPEWKILVNKTISKNKIDISHIDNLDVLKKNLNYERLINEYFKNEV